MADQGEGETWLVTHTTGAVGAGENKTERVDGMEAMAVADGGCDDDCGGDDDDEGGGGGGGGGGEGGGAAGVECSVFFHSHFFEHVAFFKNGQFSVLCYLKLLSIRVPKTMKPFVLLSIMKKRHPACFWISKKK